MKRTAALVSMMAECGLPLSIVERDSFRHFCHVMDPKYSIPSRQHLSSKVIPDAVADKTAAIHLNLQKACHVSVTLDIWTYRRMHAFMAITGHTFVACKPKNFLLSFDTFKGSHTGARIAEQYKKVLLEHELVGKVDFCVSDNTSNMRKAFDIIAALRSEDDPDTAETSVEPLADESLFEDMDAEDFDDVQLAVARRCNARLPCFAHTMQLVVREGLDKLTSARSVTAKCTKVANLVHQSASFRSAFEDKFGKGCSIPVHNATRWNSLHTELKSIAALDHVKLTDLLREQTRCNLALTGREHAILVELVQVLDPFAEITQLVQGEKYATIGCIVPSVVAL